MLIILPRLSLSEAIDFVVHQSGEKRQKAARAFFEALRDGTLQAKGQTFGKEYITPEDYDVVPTKYWNDITFNEFIENVTRDDGRLHIPYMEGYFPYTEVSVGKAGIDEWLLTAIPYKASSSATLQYSEPKLHKDYHQRIDEMELAGKIPSRQEDTLWGQEKGYPVLAVHRMRREYAPATWKKHGRRKKKLQE